MLIGPRRAFTPRALSNYRPTTANENKPMALQQQITDDLKSAMKARDRDLMGALRLAIAALKNKAVDEGLGPQGDLDDDTVIRLLQSEVKRRREAAAAFRGGDREESALKEEAEAAVYEAYLPAQLGDDEIAAIVDKVIADTGASGMSEMGGVMKAVMDEVQGLADGGRVSAMVKQRLAG